MRLYVLFLVTSLSFLILNHASAYLFNFYCYCHFLSTTKPSIFPPFIWTLFFSFVPHLQLGPLVIRLGMTSLNKRRLPSTVRHSLSPAQSPTPKHCAWSQNPWCGRDLGFFFFHWCKSQLDSEKKIPLKSPKAHVWYFIVSGYGSKVPFTICLHTTHWIWLAMVIPSYCRHAF